MHRKYYIGDEMASWSDGRYAALTEGQMDDVVQSSGKSIAYQGR